ncbi:M20 family metallopeptidase [Haloechinothrix alba]|uniref:M20 family metallopeptidase n=1 Tax=Haloechinothrix alba TaxID=664784 RepID=UPI003183E4F7
MAARATVSEARLVELTRAMIQRDTTNPPGDESPVVGLLTEVMAELGCQTEHFESEPRRASVLASAGDRDGSRPVLLINGHIDVVPARPQEWSVPPFAGVVKDGRVIGRGACDMKGGIAAAIEGLRACRDAGVRPAADIVFHLVADEETGGQHGTAALLRAGRIQADACVVPEPNELSIGVAERGALLAEIEVFGRAGHGSDPAAVRSAVYDAAAITRALHCADFGDPEHPMLGRPTCNVGVIRGGTAPNIVASQCDLSIDRRTLPGQTSSQVLDSVRDVIDSLGDIDYRMTPTVFVSGSEIATDHPFVSYLLDACGRAAATEVRGSMLSTDARFMRNDLRIPTVVYGPGSMRHAHTADESVGVDELCTAARAFATIFATFDGQSM